VSKNALQTKQFLSDIEILEEVMMMGLRLEDGISDAKLKKYLGKDFVQKSDMKEVDKFIESGFMHFDNNMIRLTDKGMMMHNYIVPRIVGIKI
jgi:oxygen-independent coproporphyrinogen-3 oxidase